MSLPTPYFADDAVTIYHGDNRDLLPLIAPESVDLVLTDPPYGIAYSPGAGGKGWVPNGKVWVGDNLVKGDDKPFDPTPLLHFGRLILWGGNHYANMLPASPTWLVWHKRWFNDRLTGTDFADCEMAWTNLGGAARVYRHEWNGLMRDSERGEHHHPTQKPVALMRWCIERFERDCYTSLRWRCKLARFTAVSHGASHCLRTYAGYGTHGSSLIGERISSARLLPSTGATE